MSVCGVWLLSRSKLSLFQSRSSLQRANVKVRDFRTIEDTQSSLLEVLQQHAESALCFTAEGQEERMQLQIHPRPERLPAHVGSCQRPPAALLHHRHHGLHQGEARHGLIHKVYLFSSAYCTQPAARSSASHFVAQVLDGRIHEQVKDYLVSLCETELEGYQNVHDTFSQVLSRSNMVSFQSH